MPSASEVITVVDALFPQESTLENLANKQEEVANVLASSAVRLPGTGTRVEGADLCIRSAWRFVDRLKELKELANENPEELQLRLSAEERLITPSLSIDNQGTVPAEMIVVYLDAEEDAEVVEPEEGEKIKLILPTEVPSGVALALRAADGEVFLASDGRDLSTAELVRLIARSMDRPARLVPVPAWLLSVAGTLAGKREAVHRLRSSFQVSIEKARTRLGWSPPTCVEEELERTTAQFLTSQSVTDSRRTQA